MLPLDPLIHQPNRLQIMATLYRNRQMAFIDLRDTCHLTTGNAGSHLEKLEAAGYLKSGRLLRDLSFELHYRITQAGVTAFQEYLRELQRLVEENRAPGGPL